MPQEKKAAVEKLTVPIGQLTPHPKNPKKHNDDGIEKSIGTHGYVEPIVVDENFQILSGHGRWEALKKLGYTTVDIIQKKGLTDKEKEKYIVIANKLVEQGGWDVDKLIKGFDMTELLDFGFDKFSLGTVENVTPSPSIKEDGFDTQKAVSEIVNPITQSGDVWKLGDHRLLCGNSREEANVLKLMDGEKADMFFTDPPYSSGGYQESGKSQGSMGITSSNVKMLSDTLSTRGYKILMKECIGHLADIRFLFVFCDWKMWNENFDIAEICGFRVKSMLVWDKLVPGLGSPFRNQHELILFGSKISLKGKGWETGNVFSVPREPSKDHPTVKPIILIATILKQIESINVVDLFGGSGSTMIACEQLNRPCYMMELDPKYCDVIVKRWEAFTKKKAERLQKVSTA